MVRCIVLVAAVFIAGGGWISTKINGQTAPEADPAQIDFFEKQIRPVLVQECYTCHARDAKDIQGGLTLDTREGIRQGGDTGPAVVPGSVRKSLLVKALRHTDDDLQMPPEKRLPDDVIAQFEKWIEMGAPDPRDGAPQAVKYEIDIEKGRQYWAFLPPLKAALPEVKSAAWPKTDIDRFLLAAMEADGLAPVADVDAHTLVRRLYFDLTGLPSTPEEVEHWTIRLTAPQREASPSRPRLDERALSDGARFNEQALENLVDELLASPRFGQRWGRHWLDVVRYAESSGQASNVAYPHAWRYRDWVIDAFNADMPYDQFIRRQLAGDLLPVEDDREKAGNLVATGFLAIGPKSHSERSRQQFQMDLADEQIDATFQAFQGLTVACARCHDHKFDPIPQSDYYALAGIFLSTETCYGTIRILQSNHPSRLLTLPNDADATQPLEPLSPARREAIEKQIQGVRDRIAETTGRENFIRVIFLRSQISQLESQLALYDSEGNPKALAMGVDDRLLTSDSRVLVRGEIGQPGERVRRGFPQVLSTEQPRIGRGSGRRELAEFVAAAENPLTARVMANRVWLHLMGRGLVSTPDNFGASGGRPSHPELLDHLALLLANNGWSVKKLIREIVLSRAYQLSSEYNDKNFQSDPDNVLVWRMPKRRLEAEALRDTMLQLGGRLDMDPAKGSAVARNGEGGVQFLLRGDPAATDAHRSVYLPIVRDQVPEVLTLFDFPDPSLIIGQRETTTIPAQSLFLMNNTFVIRQATAMADRLLADVKVDSDSAEDIDVKEEQDVERIRRAYALCFSRSPSDTEINAGLKFLEDYGRRRSSRSAWAALCQALMASAEFSQR